MTNPLLPHSIDTEQLGSFRDTVYSIILNTLQLSITKVLKLPTYLMKKLIASYNEYL